MNVLLTESVAGITCVAEDNGATRPLPVDFLSVRGCRRQVTGALIAEGYTPVGPWRSSADGSTRRFEVAP